MQLTTGTTETKQQSVSIDFILGEDPLNNIKTVAILREHKDYYLATESAEVRLEALNKKLKPGHYIGQKVDGVWCITEVSLPASYH